MTAARVLAPPLPRVVPRYDRHSPSDRRLAIRRTAVDDWQLAVRRGRHVLGNIGVRLDGPREVFLHGLRVAPAVRGTGLGPTLIAAALRAGRGAGRATARLIADDNGSGRLIAWYRRLGFAPTGRGTPTRPELARSTR